MSDSKMFYGSLCLTDLMEFAKKAHSAFSRANNNKAYANIQIWLNEEPDKYGNHIQIKLNPKKENAQTEERPYIGNAKLSTKEEKPVTQEEATKEFNEDDLPF